MFVRRLGAVVVAVGALLTASCGGGGGTAVPSGPVSAPTTGPTAQNVTTSAGGISATLGLTATTAVSATSATTAPSGIGTLAVRRSQARAQGTALLYITVAGSGATITAIAATFTLGSAPSGSVFLGYWTGTEWDAVSTTPGNVNGTSVTFASTALPTAVTANPNAYFVLYVGSAASPSPSPSATATATATATAAPSGVFTDTACTQAAAANQDGSFTNVASTFFTTILPQAHTICISAWDLSSDIDTALEAAAHNGASVTVITPYSQNSSNASDLAAIMAAGGNVKTEYTSGETPPTPGPHINVQQAPMDIHAKFALVDGVAYMDGHNWFTGDVVMRDKTAADFAAIQNDLVNFATAVSGGGSFTTDKQLSLANESTYLQTVAIPGLTSSSNEYDFITESFNPSPSGSYYNDDVYDGMCQIASLGAQPTMHVMVEEFSGYSSAAKAALQNLLLLDPNASVHTESSGGLEKISMIRSTVGGTPSSAWFGSSNATTTDLYDWGINVSDGAMLSALGTYFDGTFNPASPIPTASPGVTPAPCSSTHP